MKKYIGTKTIEAAPMTAGEASNLGFKTNGNGGHGYHVPSSVNEGKTEFRGGIDTNADGLTNWIDSLAIGG